MSEGQTIYDPLKRCPEGCLLEVRYNFCPWHGEPLLSLIGLQLPEGYVIKRLVSAGGFGVVYYAVKRLGQNDNIEAAVKVLRPNACYVQQSIEDFIGEAKKALNQLAICPSATKVLGAGQAPFPHIIMGYVSGPSLAVKLKAVNSQLRGLEGDKRRKRRTQLRPAAQAYGMLKGIAQALAYAHQKGIVHRDLKPGNILIQEDAEGGEEVLVADWGISIARRATSRLKVEDERDMGDVATKTVTQSDTGRMVRLASQITYKYAPPEFFKYYLSKNPEERDLKEVFSPRTDIYQFGLVAFELLTAEFPFKVLPKDATTDQVFEHWREQHCRVGRAAPCRVRKYRSDFGWTNLLHSPRRNRMAKVVEKCLEKNPEDRYADGSELLQALTEEPAWKKVALGTTAAALVAVLAWLLAPRQFQSSPAGVFDEVSWTKQTSGIATSLVRDAVVPPDGEARPVFRVWVRSLDDFSQRPHGGEAKGEYLSQGLAGKISDVRLVRWRVEPQEEPATPDERPPPLASSRLPPDAQWGREVQKDLVRTEGSRIRIFLTALARELRKPGGDGTEPKDFLLSVDATMEERGTYTDFLEVRVIPTAPRVESATIAFLPQSSAPGGPKPIIYELRALQAEEPRSGPQGIYFPSDFNVSISFNLKGPSKLGDYPIGDALEVRLKEERARVDPVKLDARGPSILLSEKLDLRRDPDGILFQLEVSVLDRAGQTQGNEHFKGNSITTFAFVLDSGPRMERGSQRAEKLPGGGLRIPVAVNEGTRADNCRVVLDTRGKSPKPLEARLEEIARNSFALTAEKLPPALLSEKCDFVFLVLQTDLLYEGNPNPPDPKVISELLGDRYCLPMPANVTPDEEIRAEDIEIAVVLPGGAGNDFVMKPPPAGQPNAHFLWRANQAERYPARLAVRQKPDSRTRFILDEGGTFWEFVNAAAPPPTKVTTGPDCSLDPPIAGGQTVTLVMRLKTNWLKPAAFRVQIEFQPDLKFVESYSLKDAKTGAAKVFQSGESLHIRSPGELTLACTRARSEEVDVTGIQLEFSGKRQSASERNGKLEFAIPPQELQEGVAKLTFRQEDVFGNRPLSEEKTLLYVDGNPPMIVVLGRRCDNVASAIAPPLPTEVGEEVPLTITDRSGIALVNLRLEKMNIEASLNPAALQQGAKEKLGAGSLIVDELEREPQTEVVTKISATLKGVIDPDSEDRLTITAWDVPQNAPPDKNSQCKRSLKRSAPELPREVKDWLGLDWVLVKPEDASVFYVSKYEVPVGFWEKYVEGKDVAPPNWNWAPKTWVSPREIVESCLSKPELKGLYLPTFEEWRLIANSGGKLGWVKLGVEPTSDMDKSNKEFLSSWVNCDKDKPGGGVKLLKSNEPPPGQGRLPDGGIPFYGTYHFLGNAEEIVVGSSHPYQRVGGSVTASFKNCFLQTEQRAVSPIGEGDSDRARGFRLVVYYPPRKDSGRSEQNQEFAARVKAPQGSPGREAPRPQQNAAESPSGEPMRQ